MFSEKKIFEKVNFSMKNLDFQVFMKNHEKIHDFMKNRKIHLTFSKIDEKIFCKPKTLKKCFSNVFRKKNFWKSQFFKEKSWFSDFRPLVFFHRFVYIDILYSWNIYHFSHTINTGSRWAIRFKIAVNWCPQGILTSSLRDLRLQWGKKSYPRLEIENIQKKIVIKNVIKNVITKIMKIRKIHLTRTKIEKKFFCKLK